MSSLIEIPRSGKGIVVALNETIRLMAEIDRVDFTFDALALWHGRVVLPELNLGGTRILLEKNSIPTATLAPGKGKELVGRDTAHQGVIAVMNPSALLVSFDDFLKLADDPLFRHKDLEATLVRARYDAEQRAALQKLLFG